MPKGPTGRPYKKGHLEGPDCDPEALEREFGLSDEEQHERNLWVKKNREEHERARKRRRPSPKPER